MATYTFEGFEDFNTGGLGKKDKLNTYNRRATTHSDEDITDVSLAYSASAASVSGESTDSSVDWKVMNLLDEPDFVMAKSAERQRMNTSGSSYSTDENSHLEGAELLQTIAGQPSGEEEFEINMGIKFAPPVQPQVRRKKKASRISDWGDVGTPSPSSSLDTPTKSPPKFIHKSTSSSLASPSLKPRRLAKDEKSDDDTNSTFNFSTFWMECIPDALDFILPNFGDGK